MTDIIPEGVLRYLPFSSQPLSSWSGSTDLLQFLYLLHDKSGVVIAQDGTRRTANYRNFGELVYRQGLERSQVWVQQFANLAQEVQPVPAAVTQRVAVPNFCVDCAFGKACKYMIAWNGVVEEVLSESAFFSIAHLLESNTELECSFLLAAHLYYKQALQALRNFLEELILPINFCSNLNEFEAWKAGNYRTPPVCGRRGLAQKLAEARILSSEIAQAIQDLYRSLNRSIHGSESRLIHRGIYSREYLGQVFKLDDFHEWCNYFSRSVDLGIRLLRINIIQWSNLRPVVKPFCDVCHNDRDFEIESVLDFAGDRLVTFRCRRCGCTTTFSALSLGWDERER